MLSLLALAAIILLSYGTQALIGFGANIIALTLGAHVMPLEQLLPVVVVLNLPHSIYLLAREHRHIDWGLLLRRILPYAGMGFAAGVTFGRHVQGPELALGFGIMVVALALWELLRMRHPAPPSRIGLPRAIGFIGLAGFAQGLYASGGPFLAYAAARSGLSRSTFRITLIVVWFVTNGLLTLNFLDLGRYDGDTVRLTLWMLPLVLAGLLLGDYGHHRVRESTFRAGIYLTLVVSGSALILANLNAAA